MLAAVVTFRTEDQYYYLATIRAGQFGMGTGEEFGSDRTSARGSYRPIWLARRDLMQYDIRPHGLAQAIGAGALPSQLCPLH